MDAFKKLLDIVDTLLGPNGCSWDKEQTIQSIRPYLLEETHEALEAIDEDDSEKIVEELGDLFFILVFYGRLGKKSERFTLDDIINTVAEKLVRRHPHVFADAKIANNEELFKQWESIKQQEKKKRKNSLEGIPITLNALSRAQKILDKMKREKVEFPERKDGDIGDALLNLVIDADEKGVDAESALRTSLKKFEHALVASEEKK